MSDDNDWDKVNKEYDCLPDANVITHDPRSTNTTNTNNNTITRPETPNDTQHTNELVSLTTVSLMEDSLHNNRSSTIEGDDIDVDDEDEEASLLASPQSQPLQIVSVGNASDEYAFTFHEKSMDVVLRKIEKDTKVCVVSVVGAFRTGKSFLLSWFLRYLHLNGLGEIDDDDDGDGSGDRGGEGNDERKWYETMDSLGNSGFDWRGGSERNTTGIWMWSTPHILRRKKDDGSYEKIAVLLVDTQGMFDHETTMGLTAAIFGLSTLLSSYQIYNVDKRIQEDHLQQLAMFSEYGRMALNDETYESRKNKEKEEEEGTTEKEDDTKTKVDDPPKSDSTNTETTKTKTKKPDQAPFQKIEFLVRDWQNFEDDEDLPACEAEMEEYMNNVLAERSGSDLKATREQIQSCFQTVSCYLMTHPGFGVTKKKYTGDVGVIEPIFLSFLDRYCRRVFSNPIAKTIHGRELTAGELGAYIRNYAKLFESGAHFPEAATMLEATANANNTNATEMSTKRYKAEMDHLAGIRCSHYIQPEELEDKHHGFFGQSVQLFDGMANFGNSSGIRKAREKMMHSINDHYELYHQLNESRNPLAGLETFIIPLFIGFVSITLRWIADSTCSGWSQTCKAGSDVASHIYQVVFFFLLIVSFTKAKQISIILGRMKRAFEVILGGGTEGTGNTQN